MKNIASWDEKTEIDLNIVVKWEKCNQILWNNFALWNN